MTTALKLTVFLHKLCRKKKNFIISVITFMKVPYGTFSITSSLQFCVKTQDAIEISEVFLTLKMG